MKTHEVARALTRLAAVLRAGPDVEIDSLESLPTRKVRADRAESGVGLNDLLSLTRMDKKRWQAFVAEYGIPIEIRPRDASRDVLDKILRHLEAHPETRQALQDRLSRPSTDTSPELLRAFAALLKD